MATIDDLEIELSTTKIAIAAVQKGLQTYSVDGVTFSYPQLPELQERERRLINKINLLRRGKFQSWKVFTS